MTALEQRMAIARLLGWRFAPSDIKGCIDVITPAGHEVQYFRPAWPDEGIADRLSMARVPDYPNSLDAMAQAVAYLRNANRMQYVMYGARLEWIVGMENSKPENEAYPSRLTCDATAAEQAEALLYAIKPEPGEGA